jgi:hypothetical protein
MPIGRTIDMPARFAVESAFIRTIENRHSTATSKSIDLNSAIRAIQREPGGAAGGAAVGIVLMNATIASISAG